MAKKKLETPAVAPLEVASAVQTPKKFNPANAPLKEVMDSLAEPGVYYFTPAAGGRAEQIARLWAAEPRIRTLIQKEQNESKLVTKPFCVNNFKGEIKKGVYVNLPESLATSLQENYMDTEKALEHKRTDREEVKDGVSLQSALN